MLFVIIVVEIAGGNGLTAGVALASNLLFSGLE